jgi:hypothetical protein
LLDYQLTQKSSCKLKLYFHFRTIKLRPSHLFIFSHLY